jgi:hypothetical protein
MRPGAPRKRDGPMGASRRLTVRRLVVALSAIVAVVGCSVALRQRLPPGGQAIADRVGQYGPAARARLAPFFAAAGIAYPPERFVLLGFKLERELHLLASGSGHDFTFIRSYPIQGMSGTLGPKLREGDGQVPEGIYTIVYLNPDSVAVGLPRLCGALRNRGYAEVGTMRSSPRDARASVSRLMG